jgi:hypothetical protein
MIAPLFFPLSHLFEKMEENNLAKDFINYLMHFFQTFAKKVWKKCWEEAKDWSQTCCNSIAGSSRDVLKVPRIHCISISISL